MPPFKEIVNVKPGFDLKESMTSRLRQRKVDELDEAAADRVIQTEKVKTVELETKEVELQDRKMKAEMSIMERMAPPGLYTLMAEIIKGRGSDEKLGYKELIEILEYAKSQETGAPQDAPSDGMWGFLGTVMTQMASGNKQPTALETIQTMRETMQMFQTPQQQVQQQPQPVDPLTQLVSWASAIEALKDIFAPKQNPIAGAMINVPGAGAMDLDSLIKFTNHTFKIQKEQEEHTAKLKNYESIRENLPGILGAISEVAGSLRGEKAVSQVGIGTGASMVEENGVPRPVLPQPVYQQNIANEPEFIPITCEDCHLGFMLPKSIMDSEQDVVCPRCGVIEINKLSASVPPQDINNTPTTGTTSDLDKEINNNGNNGTNDPNSGKRKNSSKKV